MESGIDLGSTEEQGVDFIKWYCGILEEKVCLCRQAELHILHEELITQGPILGHHTLPALSIAFVRLAA
jgi:hypothetical protein